MPRVPTYDSFQVSPNTLPQARLAMPDAPDVAGQQMQQTGRAMAAGGQAAGAVALDMQTQANESRVDDALAKAREAALQLSEGKGGYLEQRGENALKRQSGKPLADEYGEALQKHISDLAKGLGNDAQRMAFSKRANPLTTTFYGGAMRHEMAQQRAYDDNVSEASIKGLVADVGRNFADEAAVNRLINGGTDAAGEPIKGIKQHIQGMAARNGAGSEWAAQKTAEIAASAHRDVVLRLMDESPTTAKAYLDRHLDEIGEHVAPLQRTLRAAVDREQGSANGEMIYKNSMAPTTRGDFASAVDWLLRIEGGYVANDAGKGATNLGINISANPDVDVKNLTPEKAKAIYKSRYWDAIGADDLPANVRAIAFDAAVNQGPATAKRLLAKADGDPQKLIDLRREEYRGLIAKNPEKYGRYEASWMRRLDQLQAGLTGERSLDTMMGQAKEIEDPEQRKIAESTIAHQYQQEKAIEREAHDSAVRKAEGIAFAKPGGWREIPPTLWGSLKPEDRAKLMVVPKHSDPDTLIYLKDHPEEWKAGSVEKYRSLLSESDYIQFHDKGNGADAVAKIRSARIDTEQFKAQLMDAGMGGLIGAKKGSPEQASYIELQAKFEQAIEAEQGAKNRVLSIDEKNALLVRLIKPVKVAQMRTGSLFGLFDGASSPADMRAYQVRDPNNIQIPEATKRKIAADMEAAGIRVTAARVMNAYLAMPESKE